MDLVYLDNNATTRPAPEVVAAMLPYLTDWYGNPSSVHRFGQRARQAIDEARAQVAALVGCGDSEITFTGGGTEAINTVVRGLLAARARENGSSPAPSSTRPPASCARQLAREGAEVVEIPVDRQGELDCDRLAAAITDDTALVTLLWANNETGVLFPVESDRATCATPERVPFHCDGTQAVGKMPADVKAAGIDAMSFAPHKFHGPKGVGAYYVRRGLRVRPLLIGGPQENGRRGGTENVPGIVGMGKAAELAVESLSKMAAVAALRDRLERGVLESIQGSAVNGSVDQPRAQHDQHRLRPAGGRGDSAAAQRAGRLRQCRGGVQQRQPGAVARAAGDGHRREARPRGDPLQPLPLHDGSGNRRALRVLPGVIRRLRAVLPVGSGGRG